MAKAKTKRASKASTRPATKRTAPTRAKSTTAKRATKKSARTAAAKRPIAKRPPARRTRESKLARQQRAFRILGELKHAYPDSDCALRHGSAYELLVATILSAQCTDQRVNMVTPDLFRLYPDANALATASQDDLEALIRSTGFFRNKAKNLIGMAQRVVAEFDGEIPNTMDALLSLPGVARKTANCVLGTWFAQNEGVVVDTHVGRLALRLRLLTSAKDDKDAVRIEQDLMQLFPQPAWTYLSHALIDHGRQVCTARKPACESCPLSQDCPSAGAVGV